MTCTVYAVVDIYGTLSSAYTLLFRRHTWYFFVGILLSRRHTRHSRIFLYRFFMSIVYGFRFLMSIRVLLVSTHTCMFCN